MNGRRTARGFTLIELLVTIAIITILVSIGAPMYGQFSRQSAINGAASELVASLNEVRSRAVSERHSIQMSRLGAGAAGSWSDGWQTQRLISGVLQADILMMNERRGRNMSITIVEDGGANTLTFDREGRPGAAATFTICDSGDTGENGRTVQLTGFGRVSVANFACP